MTELGSDLSLSFPQPMSLVLCCVPVTSSGGHLACSLLDVVRALLMLPFPFSAAQADPQGRCCSVCALSQQKALPEPGCCSCPSPTGSSSGLNSIQQSTNALAQALQPPGPAVTQPCPQEGLRSTSASCHSQHSLAFPTEDPAACHKS